MSRFLIDAATLWVRLKENKVRLIDVRFSLADPLAGVEGYKQGHLPGAVYADLNKDLSNLTKTGHGRHPLPDMDVFARKVGQWGLALGDKVVVYDAGDGSMAAARLWWMLNVLGGMEVSILDGGLASWLALDLPMSDAVVEVEAKPSYPQQFDMRHVVSAAELLQLLDTPGSLLLDARASERYAGKFEPIDPVAGHVPGAVNYPFTQNLLDGKFKSAEQLREAFLPVLAGRSPSEVVVMCGSGVTACHLLFALKLAGLGGARVYADSWSGWVSDASRPVATGLS